MKVTKEQAALNRQRVLQTASGLYREHGFDGIGVADLMKSAGMTHGAFYGQFASKEDLMAQACTLAIDTTLARWRAMADKAVGEQGVAEGLARMEKSYLSKAHRDAPGHGCLLASLGSDVARQAPAVKAAVTSGTASMLDMLTALMPDATEQERRRHAIETYASMVGAMVLARAVDDEALSEEVLKTVLTAVLGGTP